MYVYIRIALTKDVYLVPTSGKKKKRRCIYRLNGVRRDNSEKKNCLFDRSTYVQTMTR